MGARSGGEGGGGGGEGGGSNFFQGARRRTVFFPLVTCGMSLRGSVAYKPRSKVDVEVPPPSGRNVGHALRQDI